MDKHRHRFTILSWSEKEIVYSCRCGEHKVRSTTEEEEKEIKESNKDLPENHPDNIHRVWFEFKNKFFNSNNKWKYEGQHLIYEMKKWAKKHPDDVFSASVDDSYHTTSNLFFIVHRNKYSYHGTTVVYTPQNGLGAGTFFLYPSDRKGVMSALIRVKNIEREMARIGKEMKKSNPSDKKRPWLSWNR